MPKQPSGKQASAPGKKELEALLGKAAVHWSRFHAELSDAFAPVAEKWSYSAKTEHWLLQLKQAKAKRTIVYMIPLEGHFVAAFALGEKACAAAHSGGLPQSVLEAIDSAPKYPEGRGVRLEVRNSRDVNHVLKLAAIKMAN